MASAGRLLESDREQLLNLFPSSSHAPNHCEWLAVYYLGPAKPIAGGQRACDGPEGRPTHVHRELENQIGRKMTALRLDRAGRARPNLSALECGPACAGRAFQG